MSGGTQTPKCPLYRDPKNNTPVITSAYTFTAMNALKIVPLGSGLVNNRPLTTSIATEAPPTKPTALVLSIAAKGTTGPDKARATIQTKVNRANWGRANSSVSDGKPACE